MEAKVEDKVPGIEFPFSYNLDVSLFGFTRCDRRWTALLNIL